MSKKTVLIVDDNPQIRELLFIFLKDEFDILLAKEGEECLEKWREYSPDLVILDIMLPGISGYDLCTTAKSDIALRNTPVIFLTAKNSEHSREKGYLLGAVNYLVKPVKKSELNAIVKSTLQLVSLRDEEYNHLEVEDISLNLDTMEVLEKSKQVEFTPIEFKILYAFMIKIDRVLTRSQIIQNLGRSNSKINDRVIDSHISHIRKKIKNSVLEIKSVYGEGYKLTHKKDSSKNP